MPKIRILLLLLLSSLNATPATADNEAKFVAIIKGDSVNYFGRDKLDAVVQISGSMTTGVKGNLANRMLEAENYFVTTFKKQAQEICTKRKARLFIIDHFDVSFDVFGEFTNILAYGTANAVCFS